MLVDCVVLLLKLSTTTYISFIFLPKSKSLPNLRIAKSDENTCRFLFSSESHLRLNHAQGHFAIASTCLKYLCSDCFDPTLSDEAIMGGILRGAYILQEYVISHWLEHIVKSSLDGMTGHSLKQIPCDIEKLVELRKNSGYTGSHPHRVGVSSLRLFKDKTPDLYEALVPIHFFLQKRRREYSLADGKVARLLPILHALTQEWCRRSVGK